MELKFVFFTALITLSCSTDDNSRSSLKTLTNYFRPSQEIKISNDTSILYKVVGIIDGDTYVLIHNKFQFKIRSAHINCPEKGQPFGQKAKKIASELCFNKYVRIFHKNKYHRDRLIAEVILDDGRNLNKLLVENGLAWHYKKYSSNEEYRDLELIARKNKIGLWSELNPIDPDDWRKR